MPYIILTWTDREQLADLDVLREADSSKPILFKKKDSARDVGDLIGGGKHKVVEINSIIDLRKY